MPILGVDLCADSLSTYRSNIGSPAVQIDLADRSAGSVIKAQLDRTPFAVIAGPPCQGFSRVGPQDPTDKRNSVLGRTVAVAVALDPEVIVIENVANILRDPYKQYLDKAVAFLKRNCYAVRFELINARNFGIAQRRERMILIARKRRHLGLTLAKARLDSYFLKILSPTIKTMTVRSALEGLPRAQLAGNSILSDAKNHVYMKHSERVRAKIARIAPGTGPLSYRKLNPDGVALTLICGHRAFPVHFREDRAITVREAARIQSFDDDFEFLGSRSKQMTQVANAVPPKLASAIASAIMAVENSG